MSSLSSLFLTPFHLSAGNTFQWLFFLYPTSVELNSQIFPPLWWLLHFHPLLVSSYLLFLILSPLMSPKSPPLSPLYLLLQTYFFQVIHNEWQLLAMNRWYQQYPFFPCITYILNILFITNINYSGIWKNDNDIFLPG